jgi:hypothetical protein
MYVHCTHSSSVADPGCLFRRPDPDFNPSRIPDPTTPTNAGIKFVVLPFFLATNITTFFKIILFLIGQEKIIDNKELQYSSFST